MRKLIVLILLFAAIAPAMAQTSDFQNRVNLSLFAGGSMRRHNAYDYGTYYGLYVDGAPIASYDGKWRAGLFAVVDKIYYNGYSSYYQNHRFEAAGGINVGRYDEYFSTKYQSFVGLNLGLKYGCDNDDRQTANGYYRGKQQDYFLIGSLNLNLIKAYNLATFPRTQILIDFQKSFSTQKEGYWNDTLTESPAWDKSYWDGFLKESFLSTKFGSKVRMDLKAVIGFSHYAAGSPTAYTLGGEISWHRNGHDDFLSIYWQEKFNGHPEDNFISFGANINVIEIFK